MRILIVSVCSLALVGMVYGAQKEEKKSQPKKQAQTAQRAAQPTHAAGGGAGKKSSTATHQVQSSRNAHAAAATNGRQKAKKNETLTAANQGQKGKKTQTSTTAYGTQKGKKNQTQVERQTKAARGGQVNRTGQPTEPTTATTAGRNAAAKGKAKAAQGKPLKAQHFNLAKQPNTAKAPAVRFQQGRRIAGSQNWHGQQYTVFRNYKSEWHDQSWWRGHYGNNITFVFGAPYYWRAGYWFPAWGYYPNAYYAWDGPIYAYNRLPPDQVIANVQAALQQQGYYHGEVDGLIGPLTRGAIADYQRAHGLYTTSTIDQPTLQSLGIA
jgi:Putative peptidoglycan binding domain